MAHERVSQHANQLVELVSQPLLKRDVQYLGIWSQNLLESDLQALMGKFE